MQIKCLLRIIMGKKTESHVPHETMATSYKASYLRSAEVDSFLSKE